ncbi:P-loop containing nucleoside triphosphate hydrolase protein [Trichoderma sp. SZMC 28015]
METTIAYSRYARRPPPSVSDFTDMSDASDTRWERRRRRKESLKEEENLEIKVKRGVRKLYRSRRGKLETTTYRDHEDSDPLFKQSSEIPSIGIYREVNERGDVWRRTIEVDSWSFAEFLRKSEMFLLHTKWDGSSIEFADPFVELFFRRDALRALHDNADQNTLDQDHDTRHNISIAGKILEFLDQDAMDIGRRLEEIASGTSSGVIQFIDLWMLYPPGTLIFELQEGTELSSYMVDSVTFEKASLKRSHRSPTLPPLKLHCWAIDYDGVKFGRRAHTLELQYFPGTLEISELRYMPEKFLKDGEKVKAVLKARGQTFWAMQGSSFRQVASNTHAGSTRDQPERVVVDRKTHRSLFGGWSLSPDEMKLDDDDDDSDGVGGRSILPPSLLAPHLQPHLQRTGEYYGNKAPQRFVSESGSFSSIWYSEYNAIDPLSQPDDLVLLLCPKRVHAFCLRDKTWNEYDVSKLKAVEFRENAWSRLVLNDQYKDVIRAMVKSYLTGKTKFQDLVAGKGTGLVILMHGPPGVGKTLTAECAAEAFQKPLYMVTAGDLGTDPENLEKKLSKIFDYAVSWNAILLLDEADIFLQDRDYDNLQRNALVSIFLRTLEYFNGIMFLTTNRVGAFDQAFQSRIHITIGMPEFDDQRRKEVWKIFIQDLGRKRSDGSAILTHAECRELGREVVDSWAAQPLNGRQIRNCVRSALALAEDKGVKPNASHFNTVIKLGNAFTQYMKHLRKVEEDEIAQIKGDRLANMKAVLIDGSQKQKENDN